MIGACPHCGKQIVPPGLSVDLVNSTVAWKGERRSLRPAEAAILGALKAQPVGSPASAEDLVKKLGQSAGTIRTNMTNLRKALAGWPFWIRTYGRRGHTLEFVQGKI